MTGIQMSEDWKRFIGLIPKSVRLKLSFHEIRQLKKSLADYRASKIEDDELIQRFKDDCSTTIITNCGMLFYQSLLSRLQSQSANPWRFDMDKAPTMETLELYHQAYPSGNMLLGYLSDGSGLVEKYGEAGQWMDVYRYEINIPPKAWRKPTLPIAPPDSLE